MGADPVWSGWRRLGHACRGLDLRSIYRHVNGRLQSGEALSDIVTEYESRQPTAGRLTGRVERRPDGSYALVPVDSGKESE